MNHQTQYRLPNFLIIGAMKAGTTTLYDDLAAHPDAVLPPQKEPDILHMADSIENARKLWDRHFSTAKEGSVLGEASTMYTMAPEFPQVAKLARDTLGPNTRIIYIIRDPIDRIVSHLAHDCAANRIDPTEADKAVLQHGRYVNWSDYYNQICPWLEHFGPTNVKVIKFEDLTQKRHDTAREVAKFVGLDPTLLPTRTDISNLRGTQRIATFKLVNDVINSELYRKYLRSSMPTWLRSPSKALLTRNLGPATIQLSPDTLAELKLRLHHVGPKLRSLGIVTGDW